LQNIGANNADPNGFDAERLGWRILFSWRP